MRIVNEIRDGGHEPRRTAVTNIEEVDAMRAASARVGIPHDVRRYIVEAIAATRTDPELVLGASAVATLALVQATAANAITHGRTNATLADAHAMLGPILAHRVVTRTGGDDSVSR